MDIEARIRKPIEPEMARYEALFDQTLHHADNLLGRVLQHIGHRHGKMMRPMLVLLCAKEAGGVGEQVLHAAVSLEMLHTASLVHDDIVDDSTERRGQASANALYGNKVAVLSGDYLLSVALGQAAATGHPRLIKLISRLGESLSEGEIIQLSSIKTDDLSEEVYFDIIRRKTATLFATCAQIGMLVGGASDARVEAGRRLGETIGLCFQIRDDIFDYFPNKALGKPTGNDMAEGKLTLPAIYAINHTANSEMRARALRVKSGTATRRDIEELVDFTEKNGGIAYAEQRMYEFRVEGRQIIAHMHDETVKNALYTYLDYVIERNV